MDERLPAKTRPLAPHLFGGSAPKFVGREVELQQIADYFAEPFKSDPHVVSICGSPGEGKFRLACEYATRYKDRYDFPLCICARTDMLAFCSCAQVLGQLYPGSLPGPLSHSDCIRRLRAELERTEKRWLLVLHSYDSPDEYPDITRLIPAGGRGHVLFTSCSERVCTFSDNVVSLGPLTDDNSIRLLLDGYPQTAVSQYKSDWLHVLPKLSHLTLSLTQAATILCQRQIPIDDPKKFAVLLDRFTRNAEQQLQRARVETGSLGDGLPPGMIGAFATWEMLLDHAEQHEGILASQFTNLLAFMDRTQMSDSIFRYGWSRSAPEWLTELFNNMQVSGPQCSNEDTSVSTHLPYHQADLSTAVNDVKAACRSWSPHRFWTYLEELQRMGLIELYGTETWLWNTNMHSLIQTWIQVKLTPSERTQYAQDATKIVGAVVMVFPWSISNLTSVLELVIHIDACLYHDSRFVPNGSRLGESAATFETAQQLVSSLHIPGRFKQALRLADCLLVTCEDSFGDEDPKTLSMLDDTANIYHQLGQWGIALERKKKVLQARRIEPTSTSQEVFVHFQKRLDYVQLYSRIHGQTASEQECNALINEMEALANPPESLASVLLHARSHLSTVFQLQGRCKEEIELLKAILESLPNISDHTVPHPTLYKQILVNALIRDGQTQQALLVETDMMSGTQIHQTLPGSSTHALNKHTEGDLVNAMPQSAWLSPYSSDIVRLAAINEVFQKNEHVVPSELPDEMTEPGVPSFPVSENHNDSVSPYKDLSSSTAEIRILTIFPGTIKEPIRARMDSVALDFHPQYTALSYCWGEPGESCLVNVNDMDVPVGKSLEIALRYMRNEDSDSVVWADGICINQQDLVEKSKQVRLMRQIYSNAAHVRVWLGESADNSDTAMDFLRQLNDETVGHLSVTMSTEEWIALKHICERRWWSRVWVVQEALSAKSLRVYCGRRSVSINQFAFIPEVRRRNGAAVRSGSRSSAFALWALSPFASIVEQWKDWQKRVEEGTLGISHLVRMLAEFQASVPHDKIFALLGLSRSQDKVAIKLDYRMSLRRLMILMAKHELLLHTQLHPLRLLQSTWERKDLVLPSWVPDYAKNDRLTDMLALVIGNYTVAADNAAWTRLGLFEWRQDLQGHNSYAILVRDEGSFETLVVTGLVLDIVRDAFQTPWEDLYPRSDAEEDKRIKKCRREKIIEACREWEQHVTSLPMTSDPYKANCGRREAFWRTLVANGNEDGHNLDHVVNHDFGGRFEAWMNGGHADIQNGEYIHPFNTSAISRLLYRSFIVTESGYLGQGSCGPQKGDLVCILKGARVPFVLRPRKDEYFELVGEAYVHGVMNGEFVRSARPEQVREFGIR